MKYFIQIIVWVALPLSAVFAQHQKTMVSIRDGQFLINGELTLPGKTWEGHSLEGLLPNARLVQGIFDDRNPETRAQWAYPDTGKWDPERNTREFVAAMASWREHGLLAFTINLQGGSPYGYSSKQPWYNSAILPDGSLDPHYLNRLKVILDRADQLGMAVFLGIFYFGQDERVANEAAVVQAVKNTVNWVLDQQYQHVLIEVNNECDISYDHEILQAKRVHELIELVKSMQRGGKRLLVSTSFGGGTIPTGQVIEASDYILLHGNGVNRPARIVGMVEEVRKHPAYRGQPIVFNEDDHFDFDQPMNHFKAATSAGASWGYFDYRMKGEKYADGFQSMPVDWSIASARKRAFFGLLKVITQ
jgi:hypothetical protein